MTDRLRESVSALIDGEADDLEWRRLLAGDDFPQVREIWADFQRARGSLNGCEAALAGLDISGRVQAVLAAEPALVVAEAVVAEAAKAERWRWWRPAASVAVAASMAAVVVVGMRGLDGDATASPAMAAVGGSPIAGIEPAAVSPTAGKVYPAMPSPLRGSSTVSASYGGVPGNIVVPVQTYGTQQSRAEAEALLRRRLQTYLLMQVERDHAQQPSHP